jgi:mono/diheme cytochrome c family protein
MLRLLLAGWAAGVYALAADSSAPATFAKNVLPILEKNCQRCHRPGQVAPMSFLSYESTRPWAKAIKTAVLSRKMPPWPADPRFGRFLNDPTLTQSEINTLVAWVDGGAAGGETKDNPPPAAWQEGWNIRPDVIVSMPKPIAIPAKGVVELMDITIPGCFKTDTWVTAIEILPGNRSVVHHADLSFVPHTRGVKYGVPRTEMTERDADGVAIEKVHKDEDLDSSLNGWEAIYVPGTAPANFGLHGGAKLIPAGSDFVIQMHYVANGTATTDQTRIGFKLAKEKPKHRFLTLLPTALKNEEAFHIPAGDPNWETRTEIVFKQNAEIVWFLPHMHLRGKDMTYRLMYPTGDSRTLLSVKYDFDWQLGYELESPIPAPRGTKLQVTAHFDNSANNRFNPNPNRDVWWGDQTWEEMMIPFLGVIVDPDADPAKVIGYSREFAGAGRR